jgi:hypothetical protein
MTVSRELVDGLRFNYGSPKQLLTTLKKWIKMYQKTMK